MFFEFFLNQGSRIILHAEDIILNKDFLWWSIKINNQTLTNELIFNEIKEIYYIYGNKRKLFTLFDLKKWFKKSNLC